MLQNHSPVDCHRNALLQFCEREEGGLAPLCDEASGGALLVSGALSSVSGALSSVSGALSSVSGALSPAHLAEALEH